MKRSLFAIGIAVATASLAQSPAPRQFKLGVKAGQSFKYALNMKMKIADGSGEASMSATMHEKLLSVKNGQYRWSVHFDVKSVADAGLFQGAAALLKQMDGIAIQRDADAFNQTIKFSAGGQSLGGGSGPDLVFPRKPISPGEAWRASVDIKGNPATMRFQFDGYGTYANRSAAKFSGVFEPNPVAETVEPYTFYVDLADGKLLHSRGIARVAKNNRHLEVWYEVIRR